MNRLSRPAARAGKNTRGRVSLSPRSHALTTPDPFVPSRGAGTMSGTMYYVLMVVVGGPTW